MVVQRKWYWILAVVVIAIAAYLWIRQPSVISEPKPEQVDFLSISGDLATTREAITKNVVSKKGIKGAGLGIRAPAGQRFGSKIESALVQQDGMILVSARDFGRLKKPVVLLLIPSLDESETMVTWDCVGYPKEFVSANCR